MSTICFGQQPCGFFPKRFLVSKIRTAKKLQAETAGAGDSKEKSRIVFFYHDSDADYRETITIMRDRQTNAEVRLNFTQENKLQKKFSPLYAKRVPSGWKEEILKQLPRFTDRPLIGIFESVDKKTVADFCLEMYAKMGLIDGIEVVRSSDKKFREQAPDLAADYFADVEYQGEIVRAQMIDGKLQLHEGGGKYIALPAQTVEKSQISAARDRRFAWMQSVINCNYYIYGEGERDYLDVSPFPNIKFIDREPIDESGYAWLG
ncbi:MAG: hypothetical protein P4L74_03605 [Candidatus Doudnabacteria bacterium]|nr:hypothetical protein [Candidatus Doudnabacteria bacterium]